MPTQNLRSDLSRAKKTHNKKVSSQALSVALLMDDVEAARDLSRIFRKVGVIPFIYQDLQHFWDDIYGQRPALSVVDVKMMSQGELLFRDHPLVKSSQLELSFYYGEDSRPLLYSVYELDHLGLISDELNLKGQVKTILRRYNEKIEYQKVIKNFQEEEARLEDHVTGLLKQLENLKEKRFYEELSDSIIERFEALKNTQSFEDALDRVMGSLQEVKNFSIYELSKNGQKLLSPQLTSRKYQALPPVWLGTTSSHGIQSFAQGMAQQVGAEIFGGELMAISICGEHGDPDKLLLLELSDENLLNLLNWDRIERYLSGLYARHLISERELEFDVEAEVSPWQMMGLLDRIYLDGKSVVIDKEGEDLSQDSLGSPEYGLIAIDFTKLLNFIRERKTKVRFYWNDFHREFFKRFEVQYKSHFRLATFGVQKALLLVEKKDADRIFSQLRAFISRYPLWRYFEDVDVVLARDLRPEIKMVPLSSLAVLNSFEEGLGKIQTLSLAKSEQEEKESLAKQMREAQESQVNPMAEKVEDVIGESYSDINEDDIVSSLRFTGEVSDSKENRPLKKRRNTDLSLDI